MNNDEEKTETKRSNNVLTGLDLPDIGTNTNNSTPANHTMDRGATGGGNDTNPAGPDSSGGDAGDCCGGCDCNCDCGGCTIM